MIYLPQIGYILAVNAWEADLTEEDFSNIEGLEFLFCTSDVPHFKTRRWLLGELKVHSRYYIYIYIANRCRELDEALGDTATAIADIETKYMINLSQYITANAEVLLEPTR